METDSVLEVVLSCSVLASVPSCTDLVRSLAELALLVPSWHRLKALRTPLVGPYLLDLSHYHSSLVAVGHAYRLDLHASLVHLLEDNHLFHLEDIHHDHLFPCNLDLIDSNSWCYWILGVATGLLA